MRLLPAYSARATAQRGQRRTAGLIPDWLSFSTSSTVHPAGGAAPPWLVSDVRRSIDVEMPIMLWTSSVNYVNSVTCTQRSSPEHVIPQRDSAKLPRHTRHEMICHAKGTAAGSSGSRAGSGGRRNATSRRNPSTTGNAGKPCKGAAPNGIRRVSPHRCSVGGVENLSWFGTSSAVRCGT
jgi:hypothetical protein